MTADLNTPATDSALPPTYKDIIAASHRLAGHAHRTPVVTCAAINEIGGAEFFFKCENLQKVGAFKFRGAFNALAQLDKAKLAQGVVTHSSGNHAQALALAARLHESRAWIVMPSTANPVKRAAVEGYGAKVIVCEPTLQSREEVCAKVAAEHGATLIHPFNHPHIIAGQGTAALELLQEVPDLDAIVAPIGGGGLISGTCLAASGVDRSVKVFAAEPSGADDAARSKAAGRLILQTAPNTIADGLLTSLGDLTWPFVRDVVEQVITISDEQTIEAMRTFFQRAKFLVEPSSAVAIAAAIYSATIADSRCKKVGVIISGGNVDLDNLPW